MYLYVLSIGYIKTADTLVGNEKKSLKKYDFDEMEL